MWGRGFFQNVRPTYGIILVGGGDNFQNVRPNYGIILVGGGDNEVDLAALQVVADDEYIDEPNLPSMYDNVIEELQTSDCFEKT